MAPRIYLASKSPRRRELLRQIGVQFDVLTFRSGTRGEDADVDETPLPGEAVERYVERLALSKAEAGVRRTQWRKMLPQPVLAADTALELDGDIIGKPVDVAKASAKLTLLADGVKQEVALNPSGDRLEVMGQFKATGAKAVALVTLPGKPAVTVRFVLR